MLTEQVKVFWHMLGEQYKMVFRWKLGNCSHKKLYSMNAWRLFTKGDLFSEYSPYIRRNFNRLLTFAMHSRTIRNALADID